MTLNIASCNTNVPISINPADLYVQRPPSNHRNELKLCNMLMNDFPYGVFSNPWGYAPESTCIWAWTPLSQTLTHIMELASRSALDLGTPVVKCFMANCHHKFQIGT
jgi:hypothetical protein